VATDDIIKRFTEYLSKNPKEPQKLIENIHSYFQNLSLRMNKLQYNLQVSTLYLYLNNSIFFLQRSLIRLYSSFGIGPLSLDIISLIYPYLITSISWLISMLVEGLSVVTWLGYKEKTNLAFIKSIVISGTFSVRLSILILCQNCKLFVFLFNIDFFFLP
jgi:hypothetical protein